MSSLIDEYTKNKSPEDKKEVERRVREMAGNMSELSALMLVLEEMRQEGKKDGGIMRLGFQDGTEYNEDSKEKLQDIFTTGMEKINRATGIDQITSANFPGSFDSATGSSSDFRHQASADLLAEALGKGKFGTVGYLSGAIGSSGLGAIKEIGDLAQNLYQGDMSAKDAFSQFLEDNVSNIKGAFTPPDTTTEELYEKIIGDYQMENPFGILRSNRAMMIQEAQQRAIDAMLKNRRDENKKIKTTKPGTSGGFIPTKKTKKTTPVTGTTKPGTGGGGGGFDTSAADKAGTSLGSGQFSPKTSRGRSGYTSGGIAKMLGE